MYDEFYLSELTVDERTITVSDGETFPDDWDWIDGTGVVFRGDAGDWIDITASGDNWTIRNTAIDGHAPPQGSDHAFALTVSGTGTIENSYVSGGYPGVGYDCGGIRASETHAAPDVVTIRECFVEGFTNHAVHGSTDGGDSTVTGGGVRVLDSVARHNTAAAFRVGQPNCLFDSCVVVVGERSPGPFQGQDVNDGRLQRGIWVDNDVFVTIRACDIYRSDNVSGIPVSVGAAETGASPTAPTIQETAVTGGVDGIAVASALVDVIDLSSVGDDPDISIPDGCPTHAEEAANGGGV